MALKSLLRRIALRLHDSAVADLGRIAPRPELVTGLTGAGVHPSARLTVEDDTACPERIVLGKGIYLGAGVELAALARGNIVIGDDTSLQGGCLIGGDVRIGAHCLFGKYVFVSSTMHRFRDRPAQLIRDQDHLAWSNPEALTGPRSRQVIIEDDCWIGQGVVINPGVTIGRGAVIGANSVVTNDVAPYEIHGGVPARRISARLEFAPPTAISALNDDHIPYFYRGFALSQQALAASRASGIAKAGPSSCLVLAKGRQLRLEGACDAPLRLEISVNGAPRIGHDLPAGAFALAFDIPPEVQTGLLATFTTILLQASGPYGIAAASISS
jgi:acetyltransferase-like isoleucine patch superfamily enzyme